MGGGVGDEEADDGDGDDVEEGDAPEYLFDGCWEGFGGVVSFCCGETDEFGAGKGEGGCDEDVAEAFEAVVEGSWVSPVFTSYVAAVLGSAAVYYYAEDSMRCK